MYTDNNISSCIYSFLFLTGPPFLLAQQIDASVTFEPERESFTLVCTIDVRHCLMIFSSSITINSLYLVIEFWELWNSTGLFCSAQFHRECN